MSNHNFVPIRLLLFCLYALSEVLVLVLIWIPIILCLRVRSPAKGFRSTASFKRYVKVLLLKILCVFQDKTASQIASGNDNLYVS